jgi:hypothetical protein
MFEHLDPENKYHIERFAKAHCVSPAQFYEKCAPNYDYAKLGSKHKVKQITIGNEIVDIDEQLAPLIEIINKIAPSSTQMCCQYNSYGYAYISFSLNDFTDFTRKLVDAAKMKYPNEYENLEIIKRFHCDHAPTFKNEWVDDYGRIDSNIFRKEKFFVNGTFNRFRFRSSTCRKIFMQDVWWEFLPTDIPTIISQMTDLLYHSDFF